MTNVNNSRKKYELDPVDRAILNLIQKDASLSHAAIGEKVGLSVSTVNERIRKLRANNVIQKIVAIVDPIAIGSEVFAYLMISVSGPEKEVAFGKAMSDLDEVLECHHVTGEYSYLLKIRTTNTRALELLLMNKIKSLPGVIRSFTQIVLSSPKEETALLYKYE